MNIVLVHPVHGAKVAISEAEVAADALRGWTVYGGAAPARSEAEVAPAVQVVDTVAPVQARKRRGRPRKVKA